jgi:hypothetical protein
MGLVYCLRRLRGGTMPINRLLKDKRTPEEIEFLNKAFNHTLNLLARLIVTTRFAI